MQVETTQITRISLRIIIQPTILMEVTPILTSKMKKILRDSSINTSKKSRDFTTSKKC